MDKSFIFDLIDKMCQAGLTSLDYSEGDARIKLGKNPPALTAAAAKPAAAPQMPPAPSPVPSAASGCEIITSPIVGTFYPAPSADAPPFVRPGSKVKAGDTLCILEAMKMMNALEAEFDCEIVSVKAAAAEMVEYGAPLFEVKRL